MLLLTLTVPLWPALEPCSVEGNTLELDMNCMTRMDSRNCVCVYFEIKKHGARTTAETRRAVLEFDEEFRAFNNSVTVSNPAAGRSAPVPPSSCPYHESAHSFHNQAVETSVY